VPALTSAGKSRQLSRGEQCRRLIHAIHSTGIRIDASGRQVIEQSPTHPVRDKHIAIVNRGEQRAV
jgi:hypothetical protein